MASQVPDPKTWRPSEKEWYPRLHIGQHWQDMSIPVYCYLEQSAPGTFSEIKWAIRPLGDPLKGQPLWTNFTLPINSIINQIACLSYGMKQELMSSMKVSLTAKYLAQLKFDAAAPVYREEDLEKRAGFKGPDHRAGSSRSPIQLEAESGPSKAANREKTRDGTTAPPEDIIMTLQLNDSRRGRRVEEEGGLNNSAKRTKTKDENASATQANQTPLGPKQWNYFDHVNNRKPSNFRH